MSRKLFSFSLGVAALLAFAGLAWVPISSAALAPMQQKPAGLTRGGIDNARKAGLPNPLVAMVPQSSLKLLAHATKIGPHAADSTIALTIGLKLRNTAGLKSFLQQVQNPHSPVYHQWLTPDQFTAHYGPSKADVAQVTAFLEAHGIQVKGVSSNRLLIHTKATTAAYERALSIGISDYELDGRSFYSTTDRPKLPRAIAPLVANVLGLNHGARMHSHHGSRPAARSKGMHPNGAPVPSMTQFNPHQIATAYDWPSITDTANGAGVTIGVVTAASANVSASDYDNFWRAYGLPAHSVTLVPVGGAGVSIQGAIGETLLDIEWSGAMAPGADEIVYNAADTSAAAFTETYNRLVQDNDVQVMTTSWGLCDAIGSLVGFKTNEAIFAQAAAQGISIFAAAGDGGAVDTPCPGGNPYNNANYPSSSAYVTAANGTQLSISDPSGTWAFETTWNDSSLSYCTGRVITGGGFSSVIARPAWQTGPGIPAGTDRRMNSDLALNASCSHPLYAYGFGSWRSVYGTSAVAPMLAGLFAIAVSQRGERLGQANVLIYNDVNANDTNYGTDFHDVTTGCNGYLPGGSMPSCAGTGWDHPTGWGSPKATSLLAHIGIQGAKGTLSGSVTDAASGAAIAGAKVVIVGNDQTYTATTDGNGTYSQVLPAGGFSVTVSDFGYADGTASVSITDGTTTTRDFVLSAAPKARLSGKVSDGSGHGYGLYADIKISTAKFGQVADVWTDPATGEYSVTLPKGAAYTMNVAAAFDGYNTASQTVALGGDTSKDVPLTVTGTCTAPGYRFVTGGLGEDFNGATFPPDGWTVTNPDGSPVVWELTSAQPYNKDNYTGGTGTAAEANSNGNNPNSVPFDTSLVTPPIAATSLHGATVLRYKANYQQWSNTEALDLDITTDGGTSWTNIRHWKTSYGALFALPGANVQLDLASYLPTNGDFQLRWRYYNPAGGFVEYAMIDDVVMGACRPIPGGFVMGQVSDGNTGEGILGAIVADEHGAGSLALSNAADPNLPVGFYLFFDTAGEHTLTASDRHYSPQTAGISLSNNGVVTQNFVLDAARFGTNPDGFDLHVPANGAATASFALSNSGGAAGRFSIVGINAPAPSFSRSSGTGAGAPLIRVPVANPDWISASLPWIQAQVKAHAGPDLLRRRTAAAPGPRADGAWQPIAAYPLEIADNTAARDPATGKIYSTDGYMILDAGSPYAQTVFVKSAYVYGPEADGWSPIADAPVFRAGAVSAFMNGKYYVVNGGDASPMSNPVAELDIYDPATGQWSTGTPNPAPTAGGSGSAVLNGLLYIVGGCASGACASKTSAVQVYDPAVDSWSSAAPYPRPADYLSCGAIHGKLYCAGGLGTTGAVGDGYVYDPSSNSWSPIADMFFPLGGSFYTAANGLLVVAGGFDSSAAIINEVEAYDPRTDSWIPLPNLPKAVARGAHACGLYQIGGIAGLSSFAGATLTSESDVLPGYAPCQALPSIPWLTVAPASGTLNAGASAKVTLNIEGNGQPAFTTSRTYLSIANDSPYGAMTVPLTVHWDPQPVDLVVTGEASPDPLQKGGNLSYTLTVRNKQAADHGAATETTLTYGLPDGVSYIASNGDASCTAPADGSSPASEAAGGGQADTVSCDFGTVALGATKSVTLAVRVAAAGVLKSTFDVSAREPDSDTSDNSVSLSTAVVGMADLALDAPQATTLAEGGSGALEFTLTNAGPDAASDVKLAASGIGAVNYQSAAASQGTCTTDGGKLACELGDIVKGASATVTLQVFGTYAGTGSVNAQATTASIDSGSANNSAQVEVTVKGGGDGSDDNSGGGAFGWFALVALLALASAGAALGRRRKSATPDGFRR